nr:MAG TPA: hypothetical protein [Caudoviricetes sp.]
MPKPCVSRGVLYRQSGGIFLQVKRSNFLFLHHFI